jgi:hypothetical protein
MRRAIRGLIPRRRRYARQRRWSYALSPWTFPGRRRRRPLGMRIAGMSSSTASSMVAPLALAALRTRDNGSPPASPATCSLEPALPRSVGLAPVSPPFDRPQAEGIHADPLQVEPAGLTQLVQQQRLDLVEHAGTGPLVEPPPAGGGRAATQLLGRQQGPRGGGAGHEHERGDTVAVWDAAWDPAAGTGRRGWEQRLDALP